MNIMTPEENVMTPREKSLAISYILSNLLISNLEIAVLELSDANSNEYGRLKDKLTKLKSASKNAYRILERNVDSDLSEIQNGIEILLEDMWECGG